MIVKGQSSTGRGLGAYLLKDKNERIEEWGIRGDIGRDLKETLNDWRSDSLGTRCAKPLYHAQLNPDRDLSRDEWEVAIALFEKEMGFENQPRAIVLHQYKGREHIHLVYSRIDGHGKAISDSWNYVHHEKAARQIERQLGLEKTQGVFIGREGDRPERTPSHAALQQGERTDKDPNQIQAEVSALYQCAAKDGAVFIASLQNQGYTLAQGIRGAYVIIDNRGGVHSLTRAAKVKAAELRETLSEYALEHLPKAKDIQQQALTVKDHPHTLERGPLLTPEQQKHQDYKDALNRYEQEHKEKSQQKQNDMSIGRELGLKRR